MKNDFLSFLKKHEMSEEISDGAFLLLRKFLRVEKIKNKIEEKMKKMEEEIKKDFEEWNREKGWGPEDLKIEKKLREYRQSGDTFFLEVRVIGSLPSGKKFRKDIDIQMSCEWIYIDHSGFHVEEFTKEEWETFSK